jgi:hypothetical protein
MCGMSAVSEHKQAPHVNRRGVCPHARVHGADGGCGAIHTLAITSSLAALSTNTEDNGHTFESPVLKFRPHPLHAARLLTAQVTYVRVTGIPGQPVLRRILLEDRNRFITATLATNTVGIIPLSSILLCWHSPLVMTSYAASAHQVFKILAVHWGHRGRIRVSEPCLCLL